jgi:hypothetical protein
MTKKFFFLNGRLVAMDDSFKRPDYYVRSMRRRFVIHQNIDLDRIIKWYERKITNTERFTILIYCPVK